MNAKVKCSNCGAEITNLTFSWGKKQWLWMLLAFVPMIAFLLWFERPQGDFTKELRVSLLDTRFSKDEIAILGKVNNLGKHEWQSITVEAEFYDKGGRFWTKRRIPCRHPYEPVEKRTFGSHSGSRAMSL